jgi:acetolactate synthase-1/2/3 large subunit
MTNISGGELVIRTLLQAGVEQVFALHGAHIETLFQSCREHEVGVLDTRHEAAAGHAAEGYARAARRLGVAMITAGPGFTNVVTSIANAYLDRTPVLYLAGSAALGDAETNTLQAGIDQVAVAAPVTKWAHRITTVDQLPRLTAQAVRIATSPPMGPVLLDLPMDVLSATVAEQDIAIPETVLLDAPAAPADPCIEASLALLRQSRRPVILAGGGVWEARAESALAEFVEKTGIPVYSDFAGHGLLPADHPLYGGTTHKLADLTEPHRPDAVLILGMRLGLFTLGASDALIPKAARIIHVDADAREIGRLRDVDAGMVADCGEVLAALNQATGAGWPDYGDWQGIIAAARVVRREQFAEAMGRKAPPIHPYQAVRTVVDNLAPDAVVIGDGAESYHWLNEVIQQKQGGSYLTHGYLGAVGFGLGLAMGAQTAHPDRRVLCLAGDGAVGFTIAEFDTMVRNSLPVVTVIMNNRSWAASQHFQEIVSGTESLIGTRLGEASYHEVAAGFGCHGAYVERIEDLAPAVRDAFASGRPACINVAVDVVPLPPEVGLLMSRH